MRYIVIGTLGALLCALGGTQGGFVGFILILGGCVLISLVEGCAIYYSDIHKAQKRVQREQYAMVTRIIDSIEREERLVERAGMN